MWGEGGGIVGGGYGCIVAWTDYQTHMYGVVGASESVGDPGRLHGSAVGEVLKTSKLLNVTAVLKQVKMSRSGTRRLPGHL